jgi:hypothetical protein
MGPTFESVNRTEATVNRKHAVSISLAVGVAAIAGTVATAKTVHLGGHAAGPSKTPSALIVERTKALDRTEIALRKTLKQRPPKLPLLPATMPGPARSPVGTPAPGSRTQRVIYVRPAPIIRHVRRPGGEHEAERGSEQEGGGGFDD